MQDGFYLYRPYIYFALAFYSLFISHNSPLMVYSGLLMLAVSVYVSYLRYKHSQGAAITRQRIRNGSLDQRHH